MDSENKIPIEIGQDKIYYISKEELDLMDKFIEEREHYMNKNGFLDVFGKYKIDETRDYNEDIEEPLQE